MFRRRRDAYSTTSGEGQGPTPEEEAAIESGLERVEEEKRQALLDPGPPWKIWFLHSGAKWYLGLSFLILDSWIAAYGLRPLNLPLLVGGLAAAVYLERLAFYTLWHRPDPDADPGRKRRRWLYPVRYGRWTPEADYARTGASGTMPTIGDGGPEPHEFL